MVCYFLPDAPLHVRKIEDLLYDRLPPDPKKRKKEKRTIWWFPVVESDRDVEQARKSWQGPCMLFYMVSRPHQDESTVCKKRRREMALMK